MSGVFISYRREDSSGWAGRIYDRMSARLGPGRVFIDIDDIPLGEDFTAAISSMLERVEVVVVVIGPAWLTCLDGEGRRRLDDPDDYVRREVAAALSGGRTVIPVLVNDAAMPSARALPDDLEPLALRNAVVVSAVGFDADVARLLHAVERAIGPAQDAQSGPVPEGHDPGLRECPECAELIKAKAKLCRFCGTRLDGDDTQTGSATVAPDPVAEGRQPQPPPPSAPSGLTAGSATAMPSERVAMAASTPQDTADRAPTRATTAPGQAPPATETAPPEADEQVPATSAAGDRRRRMWIAGIGAVVTIVAAVAIVAALNSGSGDDAETDADLEFDAALVPDFATMGGMVGMEVPMETLPFTHRGELAFPGHYDAFVMLLEGGEAVTVQAWATGGELDPLLVIRDGRGVVVAYNDDHDDSQDSRIDFAAPSGDAYIVEVGSYELATAGPYVLEVVPHEQP